MQNKNNASMQMEKASQIGSVKSLKQMRTEVEKECPTLLPLFDSVLNIYNDPAKRSLSRLEFSNELQKIVDDFNLELKPCAKPFCSKSLDTSGCTFILILDYYCFDCKFFDVKSIRLCSDCF